MWTIWCGHFFSVLIGMSAQLNLYPLPAPHNLQDISYMYIYARTNRIFLIVAHYIMGFGNIMTLHERINIIQRYSFVAYPFSSKRLYTFIKTVKIFRIIQIFFWKVFAFSNETLLFHTNNGNPRIFPLFSLFRRVGKLCIHHAV